MIAAAPPSSHAPGRAPGQGSPHYGQLLWTLVRTDFKSRYHASASGFLWALLKPLVMFLVLLGVFSFIFATQPNYRLNLIIGLFLWDFFNVSTRVGLTSLHAKGFLLGKAKLPAWVVVVASGEVRITLSDGGELTADEILFATGRAPSASASQLSQQVTSPQAYQQLGASALLGQAIASPVAGRLQRFFGVSKLRIGPTLPGVENNPQARLTVEQQVTRDVTITYITNVTSINAQSVRVEWAVTKQWSVVFLREENGVNSLDFLYKKRF